LEDFNAKLERENIFKPTVRNDNIHQDINDDGVRKVNVATSDNPVVKNTKFPHLNFHYLTWTSPDGKTHNQTHHILINWRWLSSILDMRFLRGSGCDTDLYFVVAKFRERFSVSKKTAQKFDVESFNLRKLSEPEFGNIIRIRSQYSLQLWRT
jgi:hypothetical protein